jgi:hypothetical protein
VVTAKFTFRGHNYISPSFKEAEKFLEFWGEKEEVSEFKTTWILTHIELAPSYGQVKSLDLKGKVEYGKKEMA